MTGTTVAMRGTDGASTTVPGPDWGLPAAQTARVRYLFALVSLVSLGLGLAALALDVGSLRWPALLVFCAVGIGTAPWQLAAGLGLATRLTLSTLTTFAAWTLPATAMVLASAWAPQPVFWVLAAVAAVLHLFGVRRATRDLRESGRRLLPALRVRPDRNRSWWPLGVAMAGVVLALGAALVARPVDPGFWGFLTEVGSVWYCGLALVLVAFVLSLGDDERQMAVVVLLLVAVLTLTPSLVYEGARSQSAFKHVDMIRLIRETGSLRTSVPVYDAWPGFFAAMAWLCDVTGIRDPGQLGLYWPPLLAVFRVAALRALAGRLLTSPGQRWIAVVLAVLADSIGADYFSPQSVGFVLGLAVFVLALSAGPGRARVLMVLVGGCTLAVTHQLSPFIVSGVLVVLAVFRMVSPWWIPALVVAPAVGWALVQVDSVLGFLSLDALGQLTNFRPPPLETSAGLSRMPIVPITVVALVVGVVVVGLLALVTFLRSWQDRRTWALVCASSVGLALVVVNPYGQEGIFRAVLFALPWLAVLGAQVFDVHRGHRLRLPVLGTTAILSASFLVASFGLDAFNVLRRADVAAVTYVQERSGSDYQLLYAGAGDLPDSLRRGSVILNREVLEVPLEDSNGVSTEAELERLTSAFASYWSPADGGPGDMYALWSPASRSYGAAYGLQEADRFTALRDALEASPYWDVAFEQDGSVLFEFDPVLYARDIAAGAA